MPDRRDRENRVLAIPSPIVSRSGNDLKKEKNI